SPADAPSSALAGIKQHWWRAGNWSDGARPHVQNGADPWTSGPERCLPYPGQDVRQELEEVRGPPIADDAVDFPAVADHHGRGHGVDARIEAETRGIAGRDVDEAQ